MKTTFLYLFISACGAATYHSAQKALNAHSDAHPFLILNLIYATAWLMTLIFTLAVGKASMAEVPTLLANWRVWAVALGTILIELGFVLAYHAGGAVQWSGVATGGMAALLLLPIGLWVFHEPFSWTKGLGIILTLLGLYFLVKN